MKEGYRTLLETMNGFKKEGYLKDFNIHKEHWADMILSTDDFEIDKVYWFEGETNPDDQSILYGISAPKFGTKGLLVNGYGSSSDIVSNQLTLKL